MNAFIPTISIVTPSLNQGEFIEQTILSVLNQNYSKVEYIIIDGGSTDRTVEILKKYGPRLSYWTSQPDHGQAEAINKGWAMASGEIIAWVNADDVYCPDAFSRVADAFRDNPDALGVIGGGASYDSTLTRQLLYKHPEFDPLKMIETCGAGPIQPSVFLKRQVFEEVGPLQEDLHYILDWEYWIRTGLHYPSDRFVMLDAMLAVNREWLQTKTNTGSARICQEHRQVFDRLFITHRSSSVIRSLKQAAYRSSYRKEAELARMVGNRIQALQHSMTAMTIGPLRHNPARELVIILYVLMGRTLSEKLRKILAPVRTKLNRLVGY